MLQAASQNRIDRAIARERDGALLTPEFVTEWRGLAEAASEPSAFAEHWFMGPALKHFGGGEIRLIEVRGLDGVLAGLMPLCVHDRYGRIPVRHVRNWVHYQCFMGTPLVRAGAEHAFWHALLGWLDASKWAVGLLTLREIDGDGPVLAALRATRRSAIVHRYERALLRSDSDAETYLDARLSAKKRKELRRLTNRLADSGAVAFETLDDTAQLAPWTDEFLQLEAAGWKGHRGAALDNATDTRAFLTEIVAGAFAAGKLDFQRLSLDGRAIAMLINFRTPPGSWSFKIAHDERLARFSPGVMIEIENLKRVLANPEIDWMDSCAVADHPMIDRLWGERRKIVQVTVPSGRSAATRDARAVPGGRGSVGAGPAVARVSAFPPEAMAALDAAYPETPTVLRHGLAGHPLLTLEALVGLATALPEASVEYNPGELPIGIDPADIPRPALGIGETVASIEENGSWMVLKRIEQHPAYAALLTETLAEIRPLVAARTGAMLGLEGFVFISSPGAVTPFHFDPEHNILMQIRGEKTMTVFPAADPAIVGPKLHEAFHLGEHHRNLPWNEAFAAKGRAFELTPGDAIHVPVKAPHWVKNGPAVSVSLSVTWRSQWSYAEADARALNHVLRRAGLSPGDPGRHPSRNTAKALGWRLLRKAGLGGG